MKPESYTFLMHMPSQDGYIEERPWGRFCILSDTPTHKVKRLEIEPGKRLSLQSHARRHELWSVVSGVAQVELDGQQSRLSPADHISIPQGTKHRVMNPGEELLVIIEVQLGDYFGEDDIIRYEDDFGRN